MARTTKPRPVSKAWVEAAVEAYRQRIGDCPWLFGVEIRRAMVAEVVMQAMRQQDDTELPIGRFIELYEAAIRSLRLDEH